MCRDRARMELGLPGFDADEAPGDEEVFRGDAATAVEEPPDEDTDAEGVWATDGALGLCAVGRRRSEEEGEDEYFDDDYDDEDDDDDEDLDDDFDDEFDDDDAEAFDDDDE